MFARSFAVFVTSLAALSLAPQGAPLARPEGDPPHAAATTDAHDAHVHVPYDLTRTGITWSEGLDSALNRGKPVLLFQLLGDFAQVHC